MRLLATALEIKSMIRHAIYVLIAALIAAIFLSQNIFALDQIIKPYQSARTSAMGGVKLTTGLYDQNFFGNPARVMANPKWRVSLLDVMAETTSGTVSAVSDLVGDNNDEILSKVSDQAGNNLHGRIQTSFPSVYIPLENARMSVALGILMSTQFDFTLRKSFRVDPQAISDIGPALTVGRSFMEDDRLNVGLTAHATYRVASQEGFSFVDLLKGNSLSPLQSGGDGAHLDFDIGATYKVFWMPLGFEITPAFTINNILGGRYKNLGTSLIDTGNLPPQQPRSYGLGLSAAKKELWKFTDAIFAFEIQDIGNNSDGSLFRLLHFGGEVKYGVLLVRLGFNQGYIAGGLGLDLRVFQLDLSTYGEEMTLNTGGLQDRRYALRMGFQI